MWVWVCVGFLKFGCVYVGFYNVTVYVFVGFVMRVCVCVSFLMCVCVCLGYVMCGCVYV